MYIYICIYMNIYMSMYIYICRYMYTRMYMYICKTVIRGVAEAAGGRWQVRRDGSRMSLSQTKAQSPVMTLIAFHHNRAFAGKASAARYQGH